MKLKNGKQSLRALEMALLGVKLDKSDNSTRCPLCWENGCNNHTVDIQNDPFINLTVAGEFIYA